MTKGRLKFKFNKAQSFREQDFRRPLCRFMT